MSKKGASYCVMIIIAMIMVIELLFIRVISVQDELERVSTVYKSEQIKSERRYEILFDQFVYVEDQLKKR